MPQGPRGGCDGVLDGLGGDLGAVAVEVGRVLGAGETPEAAAKALVALALREWPANKPGIVVSTLTRTLHTYTLLFTLL